MAQRIVRLDSANISFTPTGTIAASNAQSAIAEAASEALQKANNLSDLGNAASAWLNLGANQSLGVNGYYKLPNGLIFQWLSFTTTAQNINSNAIYYYPFLFPIAFNTAYKAIAALTFGLGGGTTLGIESLSNTGANIALISPISINNYIAVINIFAVGT